MRVIATEFVVRGPWEGDAFGRDPADLAGPAVVRLPRTGRRSRSVVWLACVAGWLGADGHASRTTATTGWGGVCRDARRLC